MAEERSLRLYKLMEARLGSVQNQSQLLIKLPWPALVWLRCAFQSATKNEQIFLAFCFLFEDFAALQNALDVNLAKHEAPLAAIFWTHFKIFLLFVLYLELIPVRASFKPKFSHRQLAISSYAANALSELFHYPTARPQEIHSDSHIPLPCFVWPLTLSSLWIRQTS